MVALLVGVVGAEEPATVEGVFDASGGVDSVGSLVIGRDDVARAARGIAGDAAGVFAAAGVCGWIDA